MKANCGSRGVAILFFFNFSARWGEWSVSQPGCFTSGNDLVIIV